MPDDVALRKICFAACPPDSPRCECRGYGLFPCEGCDGKGQKDGLDCTDCLGTGIDQASAAAWVDWLEEGMP